MKPKQNSKRGVSMQRDSQSASSAKVNDTHPSSPNKPTVRANQRQNASQLSSSREKADESTLDINAVVVTLRDTVLANAALVEQHLTTQTKLQQSTKETVDKLEHDLHDSNGYLVKSLAPIKYDLRDPEGHVAKMIKESEARVRADLKESEARASEERKESEARASEERKEFEARVRADLRKSEELASTERKESEARIILAIEAAGKRANDYTDKKVAENSVRMFKYVGGLVATLLVGALGYAEWIIQRLNGR